MPRGANQKLKMLYLAKIFWQETDEANGLTIQEISARLRAWDITADRKTIYMDLEELRRFGMDIISQQRGRQRYYFLGSRRFELAEMKVLVDAVQSTHFITDRKTVELIHKLEDLVSASQARQLHRQVFIAGRAKSQNEAIYYNVDLLYEAINGDSQIRFRYLQWTPEKQLVPRRDGAWYQISPWYLIWNDDNYYLVGYDAQEPGIRHYRVDKMAQIEALEIPREGAERFRNFNGAEYAKTHFKMFQGSTVTVTLEAKNEMAGVLLDRFGTGIWLEPIDEERFRARLTVAVSPQFFGWLIGLGPGVRILEPRSVAHRIQQLLTQMQKVYADPPEEQG